MNQLSQTAAEKRLCDLSIDDLPIVQFEVCPSAVEKDWYQKYIRVKKDFLESLSNSIESLIFLNLTQDEFMQIVVHKTTPENLSVRFKVPLAWGGKIEVGNMFLCRTFYESHNIDRFIIEQSGFKTVWLPNPEKPVYIPTNIGGGGPGGNSADDRMTQQLSEQRRDRR